MSEPGVSGASGVEGGNGLLSAAADVELAAWARFEREAAALDLADAEQACCQSVPQTARAAELYASCESRRRLAARLEAGDSSALFEIEATGLGSSGG